MRYKLNYTLKRRKDTFTTAPRRVIPSNEIHELHTLHGSKIKTMTVLYDTEGEDHPANAGKWFLHSIVK